MTNDAFLQIVRDWIGAAKHPVTGRLYTEMVYQPMLELVAYLRANAFKSLHRFGRRHRVHARLDREGLRHSA